MNEVVKNRIQNVPEAIWILQLDSSWILVICSPPRPITVRKDPRASMTFISYIHMNTTFTRRSYTLV